MYEMMRTYFHDRKRTKILQDRLQAGLTEEERQFLEAAEIGNLDVIKELLGSRKVKVDCCDQQGRTALEMAVTGNDVDVVAYLLERSSARHIHKALLAAADNDMERICELILDHPLYRESVRRHSERTAAMIAGDASAFVEEDSDDRFSHANLSKLLLEVLLRAAKRNNFMIVKKIMMCGVFLEEPHDYFCACEDCTSGRREDFKVYTTRRLDTFTALASPAYISLTAEDPILQAFNLSRKFRRLSELEGEYKQIYQQLDHQVQNFTLAILDQCQSSDEVKSILSGKPKSRDPYEEGGGSNEAESLGNSTSRGDILPLVYTAVRMEQKKFVAHAQCQAQIGEMWYSGVPFLRYLNRFGYLMLAIPLGMICCPLLSMAYLVTPSTKVSRVVNTPLMKFLSYTCAYLTFLVLVIVSKLYLRHYFDSFCCDSPGTAAYAVVILVFMWIIGLIVEECKQIYGAGVRDYFASVWNIIDSIMLSFLLASFVVELVTPLRLRQLDAYEASAAAQPAQAPSYQHYQPHNASGIINIILNPGNSSSFFTTDPPSPSPIISPICALAQETAAISRSSFCHTPVVRTFQVVWEPAWVPDPQLLSDVLFSLGIIFSISRFSFIMPANEALGTMLVSFRRTVNDIVKIFGMFVLVLMAFTCGIAALYAPSTCLTDSFGSFSSTLDTLTWSMFGMGSVNMPSVESYDKANVYSLTNHPDKASGAATIGHYLYGIYVFATMVVLLNLLIAVMSNSFQEVQDERDVEWKFARTELWLTFVVPGNPVPPPFNIMPSPRHLWRMAIWLCRRTQFKYLLPHEGKKVRYVAVQTGSDMELQDVEDKSESSMEGRYTRHDVMCLLIRRYVRHIERMKLEGEDGESTSNEELFRRLIERMSVKFEKRLDDLQHKMGRLESEVGVVKEGGANSQQLLQEHYDRFIDFSNRKGAGTERYEQLLDESKLQIMARMDSERIQMERVLEHRVGNLTRKLDETTIHIAEQVDRLKGVGSATTSPKHSKY